MPERCREGTPAVSEGTTAGQVALSYTVAALTEESTDSADPDMGTMPWAASHRTDSPDPGIGTTPWSASNSTASVDPSIGTLPWTASHAFSQEGRDETGTATLQTEESTDSADPDMGTMPWAPSHWTDSPDPGIGTTPWSASNSTAWVDPGIGTLPWTASHGFSQEGLDETGTGTLQDLRVLASNGQKAKVNIEGEKQSLTLKAGIPTS